LIEAAAEISPNWSSILFHLDEAYRATGRLTDWLAAFEATVELEPGDTGACFIWAPCSPHRTVQTWRRRFF